MNIILIYIILIGLCIGSFLNVCIDRIAEEKSIIWPPSHCDYCGYKLGVLDLIPIISYVCLGGRCRRCKKKISFQYPIIEFLNAVMYTGVFYVYGLSFYFIKYCLFISVLIVIAVIDLKTKNVYTKIIIFSIVSGVICDSIECLVFNINILQYIIGALIGFVIFYIIVNATKGMGKGDIDAAIFCGFFLGINNTVLTILLSFILGGIVGIMLMIFQNKKRNEEMAFIPYLAFGAMISVFFGDFLIKWYLNF